MEGLDKHMVIDGNRRYFIIKFLMHLVNHALKLVKFSKKICIFPHD